MMMNSTDIPVVKSKVWAEYNQRPHFLLFIFGMCIIACIIRSLRSKIRLPYKIFVFFAGVICGKLNEYELFRRFIDIGFVTNFNVNGIQTVFIPALIFYDTFSVDARSMLSAPPVAMLALCFGYVLQMLLHGIFLIFYMFIHDIHAPVRDVVSALLMFGSIISVTDFSLAKESFMKIGRFTFLMKLMDAESILTVACAQIAFYILIRVAMDPTFGEARHIVSFIFGQLLLAPAIGFIMAEITLYWLMHLYTEVVHEVSVSLSMAYLAFYLDYLPTYFKTKPLKLARIILKSVPVVGVLAFTTYVLILNYGRDSFSPGIDMCFQQFVRIIQHVAITLVYAQAGCLISQIDFGHSANVAEKFFLMACLYGYSMLTRALTAAVMLPFLRYGFERTTWHEVAALVMCETTHPLSTLYIAVYYIRGDEDASLGGRIFHHDVMLCICSLSILKQLIHGSCMKIILVFLGMKRVSLARQVSISKAVQYIRSSIDKSITAYKCDRFLADADWDVVYRLVNFDSEFSQGSMFRGNAMLDSAMSPEQDMKLEDEIKQQILHAKKISFLRQYEQGQLSLEAVRILLDKINNTRKQASVEEILKSESIQKFCSVDTLEKIFHPRIALMKYVKKTEEKISGSYDKMKSNRIGALFFRIFAHKRFQLMVDLSMVVSSFTMLFVIIYQYRCLTSWNRHSMRSLARELNIAIVAFITLALLTKGVFFGMMHITSPWDILFLGGIVLGWIDIALHEAYRPQLAAECFNHLYVFTPPVVCCRVFEFIRLLRWLTVLERWTRIYINLSCKLIEKKLRLGYDIGKGYVNSQDDVYLSVNDAVEDDRHAEKIKILLKDAKTRMMHELAALQKTNPGIIMSVKSQHAVRRILSILEINARNMRRDGFLDEGEAEMITKLIKYRMKRSLTIPSVLDMPPATRIIKQLAWLNDDDDDLAEYLLFNSIMINLAEGEVIHSKIEPFEGIFVIISGLIQISLNVNEYEVETSWNKRHRSKSTVVSVGGNVRTFEITDHMTTGTSFGELSLLSGYTSSFADRLVCETSVQMLQIPYDTIRTAIDLFNEEPTLERRIWHRAAVTATYSLLRGTSSYTRMTYEEFLATVGNGLLVIRELPVPCGKHSDVTSDSFSLIPHKECDIVLVYGIGVTDDGKVFHSHCTIPSFYDRVTFSSIDNDQFVLYVLPPVAVTLPAINLMSSDTTSFSPSAYFHSIQDYNGLGSRYVRHARNQTPLLQLRQALDARRKSGGRSSNMMANASHRKLTSGRKFQQVAMTIDVIDSHGDEGTLKPDDDGSLSVDRNPS